MRIGTGGLAVSHSMSRRDQSPADRVLSVARSVLRALLFTAAVCVGIGLSVLVLVGTLVVLRSVTDSGTLGSFVALVVFGLFIALPVYWLAARDEETDLLP